MDELKRTTRLLRYVNTHKFEEPIPNATKELNSLGVPTGRFGWPSIFQYKITSGPDKDKIVMCPPGSGVTFLIVIHNLKIYERMAHMNLVYNEFHVGKQGELVDERKAPGS